MERKVNRSEEEKKKREEDGMIKKCEKTEKYT